MLVGKVVKVGSDVSKFRAGDMVGVGYIIGFCRNYHPCKNDIPQSNTATRQSLNNVYTDDKPTQGGFASAMVVDSGGARIWVEGGKTCIGYMHFMHIYLMYLERKKNRNNKYVK